MIIVRAPLRISLGGGGTDLPSWYQQHGGSFVSATINKFIYMTGSERLSDRKLWLSYSQTEICERVEDIQHSFFRACLARYRLETGVEIHSISEVPGNSGLGSSGAFLVGCLTLLNAIEKVEMSRPDLAELACRIEMVDLQKASGKQDQYASAVGGINRFDIDTRGRVQVKPLALDPGAISEIEESLLLYYSGVTRSSEPILAEQAGALGRQAGDPVAAMKKIQAIGLDSQRALETHDLDAFGDLLHQHWLAKKALSPHVSDPALDRTYELARSLGASGGKLIGAGGGGYWMFYVPPEKRRQFRAGIGAGGLLELPWRFEFHGCSVIYTN